MIVAGLIKLSSEGVSYLSLEIDASRDKVSFEIIFNLFCVARVILVEKLFF